MSFDKNITESSDFEKNPDSKRLILIRSSESVQWQGNNFLKQICQTEVCSLSFRICKWEKHAIPSLNTIPTLKTTREYCSTHILNRLNIIVGSHPRGLLPWTFAIAPNKGGHFFPREKSMLSSCHFLWVKIHDKLYNKTTTLHESCHMLTFKQPGLSIVPLWWQRGLLCSVLGGSSQDL